MNGLDTPSDGRPVADLLSWLQSLEAGPLGWQRTGRGERVEVLGGPSELARVAQALSARDFWSSGSWWAGLEGVVVVVIRLVDVSGWGLSSQALTQAVGCQGLRQLCPEVVLHVAAQRLAAGGRSGAEVTTGAVRSAARSDMAWVRARSSSSIWGTAHGLNVLQRAVSGGLVVRHDRRTALAELGTSRGPAAAQHLRRDARLPRVLGGRGGAVLALSGLDGAGKTSQATALRDTLLAMDGDAVVEWSRLATSPALDAVAAPVKRLLALRSSSSVSPPAPPVAPDAPVRPTVRQVSGLRPAAWATIVALMHAAGQARTTVPHLGKRRVVIRDRWVLDSVVQLRYVYGAGSRLRIATLVVRLLAPRTALAVLLDVDGQEAHRRKSEQWTAEELQDQAQRYRVTAAELGVSVVDGNRPPHLVAGEVLGLVVRSILD